MVALSTAEAEYVALSQAAQECTWLTRLLSDHGMDVTFIVIQEDDQGPIAMAKNPVDHSGTKHIDICYHCICECVQDEQIQLHYCPTDDMNLDQAISKARV